MTNRENRHSARPSREKNFSQNRDGAPRKHDRGARAPGAGGLWLYGNHAVLAAIDNPSRHLRRIVSTSEASKTLSPRVDGVRGQRALPDEEILERIEIDRLLPPGAVHQGMAVQVEPLPALCIEDLVQQAQDREHAVVMVLDQVTDPHNVGAILRSAAAFGVLAVIVPDRHSPEETGALAKAASGALERMPLIRVTNVVRALDDLKKAGFWVAGMAGEAPRTLAEEKLSGRVALVMGAEGEGLRRLTREHCDYLVRLPMTGDMESLNVSNAAAVALYELVRERLAK